MKHTRQERKKSQKHLQILPKRFALIYVFVVLFLLVQTFSLDFLTANPFCDILKIDKTMQNTEKFNQKG
jgi:hypothetical protein